MPDTYTGDLLAVAEDALRPPAHPTPQQLAEWHSHTLRNRLPLIREALRIARQEGDAELATQLIDQAISDHPTPAAPLPHSVKAIGGDGARLTLPSQAKGSADDELPIPERVLCALLHRHWAMTIEGKPPHEKYVAHRPIGWVGEGNPFERITAPTRTELLRLLARRHLGVPKNTTTDTSSTHTPVTVFEPKEGAPSMPPKPDPNRPLTPAEEEAHRRQGELARQRNEEERRREQEATSKEGQ